MKATYDDAILVCTTLKSHGYDAFLAGGCVRDMLLNINPNDFDVTTSATPEQVQAVCGHSVPVGISFGVIKVICGENRELDIATFRTDGQYSDNRRPDVVQFSKSAEEDVKRRDFTINALLMDTDGTVVDYVDGREDLEKRILRTVGDPFARFSEDSLRMMRAIRFAVKYNLDIDPETLRAIKILASNIRMISKERITEEFLKMMASGKADKAYWMLHNTGIWEELFLNPTHRSDYANYWLTQHALSGVPRDYNPVLPLAIIMEPMATDRRDFFKKKLTLTREQDSQSDNLLVRASKLTRFMIKLLATQRRMMHDPNVELQKLFINCKKIESSWTYDMLPGNGETSIDDAMQRIADMGFPDAIINGNDLIEWKYVPGDIFTRMLHDVQTEQLEGRVVNKEQAKLFLADKFRAAPRTLEDGKLFDGMSPRRYVAQCGQCNQIMSFEVACKPNGEIDWSTIVNQENTHASEHSYYADCRFERNPTSHYSKYCTGRKAKHKFVKAQF